MRRLITFVTIELLFLFLWYSMAFDALNAENSFINGCGLVMLFGGVLFSHDIYKFFYRKKQ